MRRSRRQRRGRDRAFWIALSLILLAAGAASLTVAMLITGSRYLYEADDLREAYLDEADGLRKEISDLRKAYLDEADGLRKEISDLRKAYLDEADGLRKEIADLERTRKALIPRTERGNPLCTGSMEPTITCLDEVVLLSNFRPKDIVVGAVISWHDFEWEGAKCQGAIHRVVDIKVEDGIHYYMAKGDNSPRADGCWIPESHVNDYVVALHKGARTDPDLSQLRNRRNQAAELARTAWTVRAKVWQQLDDHCTRWTTIPGECSIGDQTAYAQVLLLHERIAKADEYLSDAQAYSNCWGNVAGSATHYPTVSYIDNCGRPPAPPEEVDIWLRSS